MDLFGDHHKEKRVRPDDGTGRSYEERKAARARAYAASNRRNDFGFRKRQRDLLTELIKRIVECLPPEVYYMKGGYFLGYLTHQPRYTEDIDMSLIELDYYDILKDTLRDYGENLKERGLIDKYIVLDTIEDHMCGGAKYIDSEGRTLVSIDISKPSVLLDTMFVDIDGIGNINVNTIEQVLCDKISVLFSRNRFRRTKDMYDIYSILVNCDVDLESVVDLLIDREVFPFDYEQFPFTEERLQGLEHAYELFRLNDPFGDDDLVKPTFKDVVEVIGQLLGKIERGDI